MLMHVMAAQDSSASNTGLAEFTSAIIGRWQVFGQSAGEAQRLYLKNGLRATLVASRWTHTPQHAVTGNEELDQWVAETFGSDDVVDKTKLNTRSFHGSFWSAEHTIDQQRFLTDQFTLKQKLGILDGMTNDFHRRLLQIPEDYNIGDFAKGALSTNNHGTELLLKSICKSMGIHLVKHRSYSLECLRMSIATSDCFVNRPVLDRTAQLETNLIDKLDKSGVMQEFWKQLENKPSLHVHNKSKLPGRKKPRKRRRDRK